MPTDQRARGTSLNLNRRAKNQGIGGRRAEVTARGRDALRVFILVVEVLDDGLERQNRGRATWGGRSQRPGFARIPALRRADGARKNSLHSLRSFRSNSFRESEHEAREYTRRHQPCATAAQTAIARPKGPGIGIAEAMRRLEVGAPMRACGLPLALAT